MKTNNKYKLTEILHLMYIKRFGGAIYTLLAIFLFFSIVGQTNLIRIHDIDALNGSFPMNFFSYDILLNIANVQTTIYISFLLFIGSIMIFMRSFSKEGSHITLLTLPFKRIDLFKQAFFFVVINFLIYFTIVFGIISALYFPVMNYYSAATSDFLINYSHDFYYGITNVTHNGLFHALRTVLFSEQFLFYSYPIEILGLIIIFIVNVSKVILNRDTDDIAPEYLRIIIFIVFSSLFFPILPVFLLFNRWILALILIVILFASINDVRIKCYYKGAYEI